MVDLGGKRHRVFLSKFNTFEHMLHQTRPSCGGYPYFGGASAECVRLLQANGVAGGQISIWVSRSWQL